MAVTVCAICLEPLTTGGALTPVHAACLGCWHPAEVQEIDRIEATQEGGQIVAVKAELRCTECLATTVVRSTPRPVHAACLGVDADLLAACKAANSVMSWMLNARLQSVHRNPNKLFATVAAIRAAIAKAERLHTTITDDHTGRDAQNPTTGDDAHA